MVTEEVCSQACSCSLQMLVKYLNRDELDFNFLNLARPDLAGFISSDLAGADARSGEKLFYYGHRFSTVGVKYTTLTRM